MRRIVEYATRDQAQNAVNSLSNQNLMGRLVYVREVFLFVPLGSWRRMQITDLPQDREAEPRFTGGPPRGGGLGGGFGGGFGGGAGAAGRQLYVNNVSFPFSLYGHKILTLYDSFPSMLVGKT